MGIVLGPNQYGKAENRVVRVYRDQPRHVVRDLNVSTALRGDFGDAHTTGDQAHILPTDTQKNTAFAFAKKHGVDEIEDYALVLGRHFLEVPVVTAAQIEVDEYAWERIDVAGQGHDHAFVRKGQELRTTLVIVESGAGEPRATVTSGVKDLVLLKTTGSEFRGFYIDEYTTLQPTDDRIMATSLTARWRYAHLEVEWTKAYDSIRSLVLERFATVYSLALQQTLYEIGRAVLTAHTEVMEMTLVAPNKHHFAVDLSPYGLDNPGEVFIAADRPYGLIQATVLRDDEGQQGSDG
ncbi:MAG: factor-independent urate hydroxylase [Candidatus Nanopelagicales bacterium]